MRGDWGRWWRDVRSQLILYYVDNIMIKSTGRFNPQTNEELKFYYRPDTSDEKVLKEILLSMKQIKIILISYKRIYY